MNIKCEQIHNNNDTWGKEEGFFYDFNCHHIWKNSKLNKQQVVIWFSRNSEQNKWRYGSYCLYKEQTC